MFRNRSNCSNCFSLCAKHVVSMQRSTSLMRLLLQAGSMVCWSVTTVSPAKMAEAIETWFGYEIRWAQGNMYCWLIGSRSQHTRGKFEGEKGSAEDMPRHVRWSIYSKWLSRRLHWHDAVADLSFLDGCILAPRGEHDWTVHESSVRLVWPHVQYSC